MFHVILQVGVCTFEIGCDDVHLFDSECCGVDVCILLVVFPMLNVLMWVVCVVKTCLDRLT